MKIKLSKSQWEQVGIRAGWIKTAQVKYTPNCLSTINRVIKQYGLKCAPEIFPKCDNINWGDLSKNVFLSEDFMQQFSNYLNWEIISYYQKMSEEFMIRNKNKINWDNAFRSQYITPKLLEMFSSSVKDKNLVENAKNKLSELGEKGWSTDIEP